MSQPANREDMTNYLLAVKERYVRSPPSRQALQDAQFSMQRDRFESRDGSDRSSRQPSQEENAYLGLPEDRVGSGTTSHGESQSREYGDRGYAEGLRRGREEAEAEAEQKLRRLADQDSNNRGEARRERLAHFCIEGLIEDCDGYGEQECLDRLLIRLQAIRELAPPEANEKDHDRSLRDLAGMHRRQLAWVVSSDLYELLARLREKGVTVTASRSNELGSKLAEAFNREFCEGRPCFVAVVDGVTLDERRHSCRSGDANGFLLPRTFLLTDGNGGVEQKAILLRQESERA